MAGWDKAVLGLALGLSACSDPQPYVAGEVTLGDVDRSQWTTLEIRVLSEKFDPDVLTPPVELEDLPGTSELLSEIRWPHAYRIPGPGLPSHGLVLAWLTNEDEALWPGDGEPVNTARFELCDCQTHTPPFAEDVYVEID